MKHNFLECPRFHRLLLLSWIPRRFNDLSSDKFVNAIRREDIKVFSLINARLCERAKSDSARVNLMISSAQTVHIVMIHRVDLRHVWFSGWTEKNSIQNRRKIENISAMLIHHKLVRNDISLWISDQLNWKILVDSSTGLWLIWMTNSELQSHFSHCAQQKKTSESLSFILQKIIYCSLFAKLILWQGEKCC